MIILLHVLIALTSVGITGYAYFRPTPVKLRTSYVLAGLTLISGLYLVWSTPSHMVQACISGVIYLSVVSVGIMLTRARLMAQKVPEQTSTQ